MSLIQEMAIKQELKLVLGLELGVKIRVVARFQVRDYVLRAKSRDMKYKIRVRRCEKVS